MRAAGLVLAPLLALLAAAPAQAVLVFERPGTREIVAAADDGSAPRVVGHGHFPSVSPDGRRVAFLAARRGVTGPVRVVDLRTGRRLTVARHGYVPQAAAGSWSPDGRLLVVPLHRGPTARLVSFDRRVRSRALRFGNDLSGGAAFSPDGSRVLLHHFDPEPNGTTQTLIDIESGKRRDLGLGDLPLWGPAGLALYETDNDKYSDGTYSAIRVARRPGGRSRQVLRGAPTLTRPIAWSADGARLLVGDRPTYARMHAIVIDVRSGSRATVPVEFDEISGNPTVFDLSGDGQRVLGQLGGDVVAVALDGAVTVLAPDATSAMWSG